MSDTQTDHGRYEIDDKAIGAGRTIKKWTVRILAFIGALTIAAGVLLVIGLYHLAT